jgi:ABC-type multidrug transport system ATPase subunit
MNELLRIEGLSKSFGRKRVLKDLELTAEKGKVYGLLGRNGAGKTTLARILMGIIPADGGTIHFGGRAIDFSETDYKKDIGYIPEDPFFYDSMTVGGLLEFNGRFYPRWKADKALAWVKEFSLETGTRIREMSRGMKLKLELAVALAAEPELLILDDPTSGLDVPTRRDFLREIIAELAASGTTILFASHLVHELERVVERIGILHSGRLVLEEDFEAVKERTKRVRLTFEEPLSGPLNLDGVLSERRNGRIVEAVVTKWDGAMDARIRSLGALAREVESLSLEDIFVGYVSGD